jgi:outer membrane protein insertion porin family
MDPIANEVDLIVKVQEGRSGKIQNIIFHGLSSQEEDDILELMVTKSWNFFLSWFTSDGIYKEEMMQHDQNQIINYLQNRGYADAKVSIEIKESESNRIEIHINAEKGEIYTFGKLTCEGFNIFTEEEIKACFCLQENARYSPEKIRDTVTAIMDLYGCQGYIDAIVNYEPILQNDCPKYDIHFTIEEGEQYRVGLVKIFGNCRTQNCVILHESLLIPGEIFNTLKLKRTEERLRNIGYFKAVNVYAVRSDDSDSLGCNYRDVYIELEEISTGNISAFFGVSSVENVFGGFNISEKNFNIMGIPRITKDGFQVLRGGGEYAHFNCTIGAKSRNYGISWAKPFFMDTPWVVGFDIEKANIRYISKDYVIDAWGFMLHAKYPLNTYTRFAWHYRLRDTDVQTRHGVEQRSPQLFEESRNDGLISATGVSLTYDSTDCPGKPSYGFRSRIEAEYAGVGGDHFFIGVGYLNTWYIPVTENTVFKTRADVKFLMPIFGTTYDTMPIDERLFLGGDNGVRGYRPFALGPKFDGTDDPRGGLSSNLFSMEYVYRYSPKWEGFVFFDAGHLSKHEWSFFNFRTSAGFGLRCCFFANSPPFTVGFGFPINPRSRSDVRRFFFSMGGNF